MREAHRTVSVNGVRIDLQITICELLSMLRPWPKSVCATEGYRSNLSVAKERLEPLGVTVLPVEDDEHLPFETGQFDLVVVNQSEQFLGQRFYGFFDEFLAVQE